MSETIERLRERGFEVEVLAPSYRGLGGQTIRGTLVHRFRYAPAPIETLTHDQTTPDRIRTKPAYLLLVPFYIVAAILATTRLARSGRFDVLHAFWPIPHGLIALVARAFSGVPVVSTFFGVELTWVRRQIPVLGPLVRWITARSDAVTVISTHTADEVRRFVPGAELRVIPFGAAIAPGEAPTTDSGGAGKAQVLFVGRLVERKGVDVLLQAMARLPHPEAASLTIVGHGPERRSLESLSARLGLQGRVRFAGAASDTELAAAYQECDLFVLPAVEDAKGDVEGLGVVLIEALLHRKPVIASRSGGIPDIVQDGRTGLLVPPGDPSALAAAIDRLLSDPALAAELASAGELDARERFSWNRIIDDLIDTYSGITRSQTPPSALDAAP